MKRGFSLIEIMIVVLVIGALAVIAVPKVLRSRLNANEGAAQKLVRDVAVASEAYAFAHQGVYPSSANNLTSSDIKYLTEDFTTGARYGYNYATSFSPTSFNCTATPQICNVTGKKIFTALAKGNFVVSNCGTGTVVNTCPCGGRWPNCTPCNCKCGGRWPNCTPCEPKDDGKELKQF